MDSWEAAISQTAFGWPEGLAHYVREHQVILPDEFVAQALSRGTPVVAGRIERDIEWAAHRPVGQITQPS